MSSSTEEELLGYVDDHCNEIIAFAMELIATPSHNPPGDEIKAAQVAQRQLQKLGLNDIEIIESKPRRANLLCTYDSGKPGRTLLLNGHLDTKPPLPLEAWETDPYQPVLKEGKLIGLGATDMKGPDAALAFGLAAVASQAKGHLSGKALLVLSADEEYLAMEGPRYLVEQIGVSADSALIAEPIGIELPWESIPLMSRGISCMRWLIRGTQTHSSICDRVPVVNASLEASRLMLFLQDHLKLTYEETELCPQGPTINLGATIRAGQAYAMVSGEAEIVADIRTLPGMTQAQLTADIDRVTKAFRQTSPGVEIVWEYLPGTLAWTQPTIISANEPLVAALQYATRQVLGESPPLGCFPGGTDAIWWQGIGGIPTVPGFGPGRITHCHKPNEWIEVDEIIQAAKIYALAILNYLGT